MQAIQTKYFGATGNRGARYKATAAAGSVMVHEVIELDFEQNHANAARTLRDLKGWSDPLIGGQLADGSFVWVLNHAVSPAVPAPKK